MDNRLQISDSYEKAITLCRKGDYEAAEQILDKILKEDPDYIDASRSLAMIYMNRDDLDEAMRYLSKVLSVDSEDIDALIYMERMTATLGKYGDGIEISRKIETIHEKRPLSDDDLEIHRFAQGRILLNNLQYRKAIVNFESCIRDYPNNAPCAHQLIFAFASIGEFESAKKILDSYLFSGMSNKRVFINLLIHFPHQYLTKDVDQYIEAIHQCIPDTELEKVRNFFTLAHLHHAKKQYNDAWDYIVMANRFYKSSLKHEYTKELSRRDNLIERLKAVTHPVSARMSETNISPVDVTPVYILGPSQSGKSTLESMLDVVSDKVTPGYENQLLSIAKQNVLEGHDGAQNATHDQVPDSFIESFRTEYIDSLSDRSGKGHFFTSTDPILLYDIEMLLHSLPNAKFIVLARDMEELAYKIYFTVYNKGNSYAYDLKWCRNYLAWYYRVCDYWASHYPDKFLVVQYESLLTNDEAFAQVLDFLGIRPNSTISLQREKVERFSLPYRLMDESKAS